jgi:hypothetical protein
LVLQAFIDDSQTDGDVLVLAGFISDAIKWTSFSKEWAEHLKLAGLEEFKMSEFGLNEPEIVASFYRIAEKHALGTLACAVPIRPLEKVALEFSNDPMNRNPFLFGFKAVVNLCAQYQKDMGVHQPIEFLFDEKTGEQSIIHNAWKIYVDSVPDDIRAVTGPMPIFRNSKSALPIQAADLIAWWYRRMFREHGKMSGWPFPWSEQRKLALMSFSFSEDDFRENFAAGIGARRNTIKVTFTLNGQSV